MRCRSALALAALVIVWACGGQPPIEPGPATAEDSAGEAASEPAFVAGVTDFDVPAIVPPEIAAAWSGVRIRLIDRESGAQETFDIPLGGADLLGESGLVLSAGVFLPDFIMDEHGITSRSAEPINPAVRVVISEDGMEDFEGWLFAAMPEFDPYPNDQYQVLLVEGIPAGEPVRR
jgi:hypothetical protein